MPDRRPPARASIDYETILRQVRWRARSTAIFVLLTLLNILHAGAIVVAINSYYIRQGQFIIFGVPLVLAWLLSFAWMLYHWLAERGTRQVLAYRQSFAAPTHDRDPRAEAYDDYSRLADDTYPDDADDEPLALDALLRKAKRE